MIYVHESSFAKHFPYFPVEVKPEEHERLFHVVYPDFPERISCLLAWKLKHLTPAICLQIYYLEKDIYYFPKEILEISYGSSKIKRYFLGRNSLRVDGAVPTAHSEPRHMRSPGTRHATFAVHPDTKCAFRPCFESFSLSSNWP